MYDCILEAAESVLTDRRFNDMAATTRSIVMDGFQDSDRKVT
jgi:hypothetical protein